MKLLLFLTADFAAVDDATGKLNILGVFGRIVAAEFPVKLSAMSIVVRLAGEIGDVENSHNLTLVLADADGRELFHIVGPVEMSAAESGVDPEKDVIIDLRDFIFPHAGSYQLNLSVDDAWLDAISIELIQRLLGQGS